MSPCAPQVPPASWSRSRTHRKSRSTSKKHRRPTRQELGEAPTWPIIWTFSLRFIRSPMRCGADRIGPGAPAPFQSRGDCRFSQVPGEPPVHAPCSTIPVGLGNKPIRCLCVIVACLHGLRPLQTWVDFGTPSHGTCTRCLRFAVVVARSRRKTRFRRWLTLSGRVGHLLGSNERFHSDATSSIPLSQALPGDQRPDPCRPRS